MNEKIQETSTKQETQQQPTQRKPTKEGQRGGIQTREGKLGTIQTKAGNKPPIQTREGKLAGLWGNDAANNQAPVQRKPNNTGLPDNLKSGIEHLSGYSMDDVKVHYNSDKPAQLNAHAYAQGSDIHLGAGQEKHLPHEAWHVVQQKQGRVQPTMQLKGTQINDNAGLEKEADVMGGRALEDNTMRRKGNIVQPKMPSAKAIQRLVKKDDQTYWTKQGLMNHPEIKELFKKMPDTNNLINNVSTISSNTKIQELIEYWVKAKEAITLEQLINELKQGGEKQSKTKDKEEEEAKKDEEEQRRANGGQRRNSTKENENQLIKEDDKKIKEFIRKLNTPEIKQGLKKAKQLGKEVVEEFLKNIAAEFGLNASLAGMTGGLSIPITLGLKITVKACDVIPRGAPSRDFGKAGRIFEVAMYSFFLAYKNPWKS